MENDDDDTEDQTKELKALGIDVVDQFSLEQNVAAKVDEAVAKQNRKQKKQILKREIKDSKLEIFKLQNKQNDVQHRIADAKRRLSNPHKFIELEKSLEENKVKLKLLLERKNYIEGKLSAAETDETVLDDVDLDLEEGEIFNNKSEDEEKGEHERSLSSSIKEAMIKEGKMTPFGTLLSSFDTKENTFQKPSILREILSRGRSSCINEENTSSISEVRVPDAEFESDINQESYKSNAAISDFDRYLQDQLSKQKSFKKVGNSKSSKKAYNDYGICKNKKSKVKEFCPSHLDQGGSSSKKPDSKRSPLKKRVLHPKRHWKEKNIGSTTSDKEQDQNKSPGKCLSEKVPFICNEENDASDSEYVPSEDEGSVSDLEEKYSTLKEKKISGVNKSAPTTEGKDASRKRKRVCDDGNVDTYLKRIKRWKREKLEEKHKQILEEKDIFDLEEDDGYEQFEGGFKIPLSIWNKLYKYQRTCVKWLWELHSQNCGGILGDEMGLGKTIMIISFLVGLSYSGVYDRYMKINGLGPVLIVCPATVLHQWVKEFHRWWPPFRVAVLHDSGSFHGQRAALIHNINKHHGVLITSYRGVIDQLKVLLNYEWHYVILDEGHKIRNPEAQITVAVKRFQTAHRLILSGSPIQNSLKELWSLFDFVFPGKLGTLQVFLQQFAVPITQGGYANASKLEVQTAFRCATVLRDTINPFLLRRMKNDVRNHLSLPNKNEQVLFCGLTEDQRNLYKEYLSGNEVSSIMKGRLQVFVGLINLRKICNHPDLYTGGPKHFTGEELSNLQPELQYGWYTRAGKMIVLHSILKLWKKQNHKVLLFTQSRQMLCILEKFICDEEYKFLKMDGSTNVGSRQTLIEKFNTDSSIFIFLLTTKVGGLGVNLTGADRVVIFDPDWNPSTDTQARERAWRIGQTRNVTIYRLLTAGTIEEKIYHRQIFKQFLTNKVLKDPKQQRFFKTNDLHELFTLNEGEKEKTESSAIFAGTGSEISLKKISSLTNKAGEKIKMAQNTEITNTNSKSRSQNQRMKDKDEDYSCNNYNIIGVSLKEETMNTNPVENVPCNNELNSLLNPLKSEEEQLNSTDDNKKKIEESEKCSRDSILDPVVDQTEEKVQFSLEKEKEEKMRALAKKLSKQLFTKKPSKDLVRKSKEKVKNKKDKNENCPKKGKKFEGTRIKNLVKKRKYKFTDEEESEGESELSKSQDDFVLQKLFKKSGVHTALSHDVIINSGDPDYLLLESEAEKVAKEALKQIRLSRAKYLKLHNDDAKMKKETKKKRFGNKKSSLLEEASSEKIKMKKVENNKPPPMFSGGMEGECPSDEDNASKPIISATTSSNSSEDSGGSSGVFSSSQLLKKMRERNRIQDNTKTQTPPHSLEQHDIYNESTYDPNYPSTAAVEASNAVEDEPDNEIQEHVELLTDIRNFIAFQSSTDGRASTDEVIQRFRDRIPPSKNHIFRALLNQICDFLRDSTGQGFWYIKEEFR